VMAKNVSVAVGERILVERFSGTLKRTDVVGLIGRNGAGKSTLLRALLGEHPIKKGELTVGGSISPGYYRQDLSQVPLDKTLYQVIEELRPKWERGPIQGHLGRFGFSGQEVLRRADSLSGAAGARRSGSGGGSARSRGRARGDVARRSGALPAPGRRTNRARAGRAARDAQARPRDGNRALDESDGTGRDAHAAIKRSFSRMANRPVVLLAALALASSAGTVGAAQSPAPLQLRWELLRDTVAPNAAGSWLQFTLTNRGMKPLPKTGWAIYFNALH